LPFPLAVHPIIKSIGCTIDISFIGYRI